MSLAASSAVDKCDPVCGGQRNAGWCLGEVAQTPGFSGRPLFNGPTHFGVCPPRLLKEEGSAVEAFSLHPGLPACRLSWPLLPLSWSCSAALLPHV